MHSSNPPIGSDPVRLEVFKHLFSSIADEMGVVLRKTSFSPNIKERRDYSCAVFDPSGMMIAQAAHIPVHLGSMPLSVQAAINHFSQAGQNKTRHLYPGDMVILNDPYQGGTHLPDITLVSPVFQTSPALPDELDNQLSPQLLGFVASRAHHADVGGMTPGSMPIAREIIQEGLVIPPVKLFSEGIRNEAIWDLILANVRTPDERSGDLWAQIAANQRGTQRLQDLVKDYGPDKVFFYMQALLVYTESMTRKLITDLPDGSYSYTDYLDDDGISQDPVAISVVVQIQGDEAVVDFSASAEQQ
jgi:N-methylhydantoinase B